jgi:hypothetical protein
VNREGDVLIEGFLRNDRERVVGEISEFNGKTRAHVRVMEVNAAGEWVHTTRGIAIEPATLPDLLLAVRALADLVTPKVVAHIETGREPVWVALSEYHGRLSIDLRHYYKAADGEFRPSKKGVSVSTDALDELIALVTGLDAARAASQS